MHTTPTNLLNCFLINSVKILHLRRQLFILYLGTSLPTPTLLSSLHILPSEFSSVIFNIIPDGCVGLSVSYSTSYKMAELAPLCQFQHHNPTGCRKALTFSALRKVLYRVTNISQPSLMYKIVFNLTPMILCFHYRRLNMSTRLSFRPDNISFSGELLPEITWFVFLRP